MIKIKAPKLKTTAIKEIYWKKLSDREYANFLEKSTKENLHSVKANFSDIGVKVEFISNNSDFVNNIPILFPIENSNKTKDEKDIKFVEGLEGKVFYIDNEELYSKILRKEVIEEKEYRIGYYNKNNKATILRGTGFGLGKSAVAGNASCILEDGGYHSAHSNAFLLNDRGIIIIGGHTFGKSTALFHILYNKKEDDEIKILTDDWLLINEDTKKAIGLQKVVSFSKQMYEEFPYLEKLNITNDKKIKPIQKKSYVNIEDVPNTSGRVSKMPINGIILLEPIGKDKLTYEISKEYASQLIVDVTYHKPDTDKFTNEKHLEFWNKLLAEVPYLAFDSRHTSGANASYKELYSILKGF